MFATLAGVERLDLQLANLSGELMARIEAKSRELADALAAKVRDGKLSGQALAAKSGALRDSITAEVSTEDGTLTATVGTTGDIKYAAIQEYGGHTSAHDIIPDKGRVLAFFSGGAQRFATVIHHPGSNIPARSYLRSSLYEAEEQIVAELSSAVAQAWGDQ